MDFSVFQRLGEAVGEAYHRANHDETALPAIAAESLGRIELPEFDFTALARFLRKTSLHQEPGNKFSDLPVVLYRGDGFFVQLLVWNESTTAIHQHAFSGAFRVLRGSSIHTRYSFREERRSSARLLTGEVSMDHAELLERGGTREIVPGRGGLVHSLYHLDHPSVTLLVRTYEIAWASPQYSLWRPCFAFDEYGLRGDERTRMLRRLLYATQAANPELVAGLMIDEMAPLDLPRVFSLLRHVDTLLPADEDQRNFFEKVRAHHGDVADRLVEALQSMRIESNLVDARRHTRDPELRFFLALLLNVPDGAEIYRLVAQRYPDRDPRESCAAWIARLASPDTMLDALVREGALARTRRDTRGLVARLSGLLPATGEPVTELVRDALRGSHADEAVPKGSDEIRASLETVPEFAALLR